MLVFTINETIEYGGGGGGGGGRNVAFVGFWTQVH